MSHAPSIPTRQARSGRTGTELRATSALFANELRLLGRTPAVMIWTVILPLAALVVMCAIPAARRAQVVLGGVSVVEAYQPTLVVFAMTSLALQAMPTVLGQYRELGFLRRLRTTPAAPRQLLTAVLLLTFGVVMVVGVLMGAYPLFFGLGRASSLGWAVLVLVPASGAFLAVGAMLAAVIPSSRVAGGTGAALAAVMWFFAGMWFPRARFPDWLSRIADWTPGGATATALTQALQGQPLTWQPLVCLLLWTASCFMVAVYSFRWE